MTDLPASVGPHVEELVGRVSEAFDWRHGNYDVLTALLDELRAALEWGESSNRAAWALYRQTVPPSSTETEP